MMRFLNLLLMIMVFCLYSKVSLSETVTENVTEGFAGILQGYRIDLGLSVKDAQFNVRDNANSNGAGDLAILGTMTDDAQATLLLSLGSPYTYFNDSEFGYYFEFGASSYNMDTQLVSVNGIKTEEKLGTSVSGKYLYLTPVLFFNFGDKYLKLNKHHSLKLGLGAGIGYLEAHGDIIFTNSPLQEHHVVDIDTLGLSIAMLIDYRYNQWLLRLSLAAPGTEKNNLSYEMTDAALNIGYTFMF
ncbi:MAG: hypothetical protein OEY06_12835 [Gammaproteobacteria bacterium]|nr:hypothetical protein [Gammaproteobacteria bacterium]